MLVKLMILCDLALGSGTKSYLKILIKAKRSVLGARKPTTVGSIFKITNKKSVT